MHRLEFFGIEVDECRFCSGLWLDPGEAEALTALRKVPTRLLKPIPIDPRQQVLSEGERVCPHCGLQLQVFEVAGTRVDACIQCKGVWLERGELNRLLGQPG
ncbi:MAG: zf-TFIIB domain-containing protein [Armatimonadetes bacterium]|nr:zf-TFIIB domain-containing protein [Armatimonadota bacterium]